VFFVAKNKFSKADLPVSGKQAVNGKQFHTEATEITERFRLVMVAWLSGDIFFTMKSMKGLFVVNPATKLTKKPDTGDTHSTPSTPPRAISFRASLCVLMLLCVRFIALYLAETKFSVSLAGLLKYQFIISGEIDYNGNDQRKHSGNQPVKAPLIQEEKSDLTQQNSEECNHMKLNDFFTITA
jgi:hypothetical protein